VTFLRGAIPGPLPGPAVELGRATRLRRLIPAGETTTVEFKLECHAFAGNEADKAELAKDICAMANNGPRHSYIIIGVSNDGRRYLSVRNPKLTDDNLQTLVRTSISPIPRVSLTNVRLNLNSRSFLLKVIAVGPNPRRAHCLARDFIDHRLRLAFRKHEVWIRRGATSDIATPDEVARLVAGEDIAEPVHPGEARVYARLDEAARRRAIIEDINSSSPSVRLAETTQLALLDLGGDTLVLRLIYQDSLVGMPVFTHNIPWHWGLEHGFLVITTDRMPRKFLSTLMGSGIRVVAKSRESFGTYALVELEGTGEQPRTRPGVTTYVTGKALRNGLPITLVVFVVPDFADSAQLTKHIRALVTFAADAMDASAAITTARANLNITLRRLLSDRVVLLRGLPQFQVPGREPAPLGRNEIVDEARFGADQIIHRHKDEKFLRAARFVLKLASSPVTVQLPASRLVGEDLLPSTDERPAREVTEFVGRVIEAQ